MPENWVIVRRRPGLFYIPFSIGEWDDFLAQYGSGWTVTNREYFPFTGTASEALAHCRTLNDILEVQES